MMEPEMVDLEAQDNGNKGKEVAAIYKKPNLPVTLKFVDVVYKVKLGNSIPNLFGNGKKGEEKVILKGVTGLVHPGEMLAMLGPSGCGKTTLLTALGGRLCRGIGGSITYNGKSFSNAMKRKMGFVTQDDVLYAHLTVTETLVFTALLRLPNSISKEEKIMYTEVVISQLGLTKCKNNIIGGYFVKGVSGGERKRVSIGQEMLVNPSLLFLDEPTSGLDSTTAQTVVSTLWDLAKGGRTVVMTIHQPSSRLFYMFDKVLLLSEGNPLYFGEGSKALGYFSSIGYAPSFLVNPSDFLLDLSNGLSPRCDSTENPATVKQSLCTSYRTIIYEKLKEDIDSISDYPEEKSLDKNYGEWPTTWWQQFSVLFVRGVKERKHETFSILKVGEVLIVSFFAGLIWWKTSDIQDKAGLLFFFTVFWGFFSMFRAIFPFPEERKMLAKERSSGTYRLSSFFMALTLSNIPMDLVLPTIFTIIIYWMTGLKPTAKNFFHTLFVIFYNAFVSQSLGFALGAVVMNQRRATTFGSVLTLVGQLAGGFYVNNVPPAISWIKNLSMTQYSFKLLLGSQFDKNETYPCESGKLCLVEDYHIIKMVGLGGQVESAFALAVIIIGLRFIAYLALMRVGVTRK